MSAHLSPRQRYGAVRIVRRAAFLPFLSVPKSQHHVIEEALHRPFKTPCKPGKRTAESDHLLKRKTLGCLPGRSTSLASGGFKKPVAEVVEAEEADGPEEDEITKKLKKLPPYVPLVLCKKDGEEMIVPEILGRFLRPHQREGVKFLFDCVGGLNPERYDIYVSDLEGGISFHITILHLLYRAFDGRGCILADDM